MVLAFGVIAVLVRQLSSSCPAVAWLLGGALLRRHAAPMPIVTAFGTELPIYLFSIRMLRCWALLEYEVFSTRPCNTLNAPYPLPRH